MKYRVTEINGFFIIEVQATVTKGMLWWKRTKWEWFETNVFGGKYDAELAKIGGAALSEAHEYAADAYYQMYMWVNSNSVKFNKLRADIFEPSKS